MRGYVPSPKWRLSHETGLLVLSGGADRLYGIEDVDEATARELSAWWEHGIFGPERLSARAREVVDELIEAGVVGRDSSQREPAPVSIRWVGEPDREHGRHLLTGIAESPALRSATDEAELLLYVRTNARLVDLYETAELVPTAHLLLDVAYDHTVSLGPLVVAGETACLACLAGRIGSRWGDPAPPERPAVLASPALAAALAVRELEKVAAGDATLADATVAYDLDAHRVLTEAVYRLPWCPVCGDLDPPAGRIDLPWAHAA